MYIVPPEPRFDLTRPETFAMPLAGVKPKDIVAMVEAFDAKIKANAKAGVAPGPLPVVTGWNDIDPTKAVDLLLRNLPGANRRIDPATVVYYAQQMARGDWKPTGQAVLIDTEKRLNDAQHRLYAVLLSGAAIHTFVVTDCPVILNGFAYIDNARPRTAATALQTAGLNGVSAVIAKVIKLAEEVRLGVFNPAGASKIGRVSPAEMLGLATHYPNARDAARGTATDWKAAADYICKGKRELTAYVGMRIADLYGFEVADDFLTDLMDEDEQGMPEAIAALRKVIDKDNKDPALKRHHIVAALIKAFNAWKKSEALPKRWMLQVDEAFPSFDEPPQAEAAE